MYQVCMYISIFINNDNDDGTNNDNESNNDYNNFDKEKKILIKLTLGMLSTIVRLISGNKKNVNSDSVILRFTFFFF